MPSRKEQFNSLKDWRTARKLTIPQAAEFIGIPQTTYYAAERGARSRRDTMRLIIERTGVSAAVLAQVA